MEQRRQGEIPQCVHHFEHLMDKMQCTAVSEETGERCHRSVHGDANHHRWAKAGPCFTYNQEVGSGENQVSDSRL